jgi:AsmA protein
MPKLAKYFLIAFAILISLLLIVVGIVAATFNPNDYKPLIIRLVQEKKQRTLAIPGDIKLSFFPKIGADLGRVSISEHNNSAEFAAVNSAKVSLELIPLLSKQLVVDRIAIDGITANIKRLKDGSTNFDDMVSKDDTSSTQVKFNIDSVTVTNAKILFDDQQQNRKFDISNLNLETGKIANGVSSKFDISANVKGNKPVVDAKLSAKSGFTLDIDQKHYVLKGLNAEVTGKIAEFTDLVAKLQGDADIKPADKRFALDGITLAANGKHAGQTIDVKFDAPKLAITDNAVSSGKLSGDVKLSEGARTINANFSMPSFEGSPQAFKLPSLVLDVAVKDAQLDAKAKVSGALSGNIDKLLFTSPQLNVSLDGKQGAHAIGGSLTTPVSVDLKKQMIDLSAIAAAFTLPNPGGGVLKLKADGRAGVDLGKQTLSTVLKGSLDESKFDAKLGLVKFSPLSYTFDIGIDRLDVDRYQAKSAAKPAPGSASTSPAAPEKPIDLSALKALNATGSLKIGALTAHNIKASNVRLDLHAANGKADINPLAANLYGGTVAGALSVVASDSPRIDVRQNLTGINIGALLTDATGKKQIDGKGNVQLDVRMQGTTFSQMKKALNGNARLELRDGAVHGINIAQIIREAKARLGAVTGNAAPQTGTSSSNEKTDFSELSGSFRITNGIAHNDDLNMKSPLLRLAGTGDVNVGEDRLDYLVKATVVPNLQGQGGPELQALKGVTVPVKLSGPFTAMSWRIDFAGMASEFAKQKVEEKKEEVKTRVQEQLQDKLKGLFGK